MTSTTKRAEIRQTATCSTFHFASPAVLELLYSRVYGGKY